MALLIAARMRADLFAAAARKLEPGLAIRVAPVLGRGRGDPNLPLVRYVDPDLNGALDLAARRLNSARCGR